MNPSKGNMFSFKYLSGDSWAGSQNYFTNIKLSMAKNIITVTGTPSESEKSPMFLKLNGNTLTIKDDASNDSYTRKNVTPTEFEKENNSSSESSSSSSSNTDGVSSEVITQARNLISTAGGNNDAVTDQQLATAIKGHEDSDGGTIFSVIKKAYPRVGGDVKKINGDDEDTSDSSSESSDANSSEFNYVPSMRKIITAAGGNNSAVTDKQLQQLYDDDPDHVFKSDALVGQLHSVKKHFPAVGGSEQKVADWQNKAMTGQ